MSSFKSSGFTDHRTITIYTLFYFHPINHQLTFPEGNLVYMRERHRLAAPALAGATPSDALCSYLISLISRLRQPECTYCQPPSPHLFLNSNEQLNYVTELTKPTACLLFHFGSAIFRQNTSNLGEKARL